MDRVLWVTGAGSGMGRAAAVSAAANGWRVALSGRRADALRETQELITAAGGTAMVAPLDVRDGDQIAGAHAAITEQWAPVTDLVLSAGLNNPRRAWRDQRMSDFSDIVNTNLIAVAAVIDEALPDLRQNAGTVVVISSFAGWRPSPNAGVAYSASKTALSALCDGLNNQEVEHGVRACNLCPGDVDSDFLALRPNVPDTDARAVMLTPDDIGRAVQFVLDSPAHVRINELVITPTAQH
jgi:NADP-dependent 3-hydroxy acid dehydrogenase YdfG